MQTSLLQSFAQRFLDRELQPRELLSVRKILYGVLILLLFTGAFFWRRYWVEQKANELSLREENRGDLKLSRSVLRLTLTGVQGLATCALWNSAMDKQKKNQWNELEYRVRVLTNLQPHFITPWLFQSWNLAYNVSVESDRVKDKYFYISRGIGLLNEGERQNNNNPDIRFSIGFYTQHKICNSDENNVMRSLFQMSQMKPNERDPARFRSWDTGEINLLALEDFCLKHPKLIRRLRDGVRKESEKEKEQLFTCDKVDAVINFLDDNFKIPSIWEEEPTPKGVAWRADKVDPRKPFEDAFPVLPPRRDSVPPPQRKFQPRDGVDELDDSSSLDDNCDGHLISRAWFSYAQEPIPDPGDIPGKTLDVVDRETQRKPKHMTTLLFRSYPALMQYHRAENLQLEGWYDDTPWPIKDWFSQNLFSDGKTPSELRVPKDHSRTAWVEGVEMWEKFGYSNHLLFRNPQEEFDKTELARRYYESRNQAFGSPPEMPTNIDFSLPTRIQEKMMEAEFQRILNSKPPDQREEYLAAFYLYQYGYYRKLGNFETHIMKSYVEAEDETIRTRRLMYEAETARQNGEPRKALALYDQTDCLAAWRDKVLSLSDPNKHREYRESELIQEATFEAQLNYMNVLNQLFGRQIKQDLTFWAVVTGLPSHAHRGGGCIPPEILAAGWVEKLRDPGTLALFPGPFNVLVANKPGTPTPREVANGFALLCNSPGYGPIMSLVPFQFKLTPLLDANIVRNVLDRKRIVLTSSRPTQQPPEPPRN